MRQLLRYAAITTSTAITGSTGNSNYAGLDMAGYEGVAFIALVSGTPSTNGSSIKVQQDSSSGFGTVVDLTGTSISLSSSITDGYVASDIFRPSAQYVRMVHVKTSTADILSGLVMLRHRSDVSVSHSTASQHGIEYHVTPSSGTA